MGEGLVVQRAGVPLLHAWLVDTGSLVAQWPGGRQDVLGPDSCVGETALVDPAVIAPALTARAPCRLFRLHRVAFQDLAREHPVLTESLCRLLARSLNRQRGADHGRLRSVDEPPPGPDSALRQGEKGFAHQA